MMRVLSFAAAIVVAAADVHAAPVHLVSNLAVYDISLAHTSGAAVVAARGRLAIAFRDVCDGWSTTQRMIVDLTDADGTTSRTDFFVTAWESKDGHSLRFDIGDLENGKSVSRQRGSAAYAADGEGAAELASGTPDHFALPKGALFPTGQTLAILRQAEKGGTGFNHLIFEGGDSSDLYYSTVTIGKALSASALKADRKADPTGLLKGVRAWPVLSSFYPVSTAAELPDYEVADRLYANGISGSMSLLYGSYTLRATLLRLEPLPASC